MEDPIVRIPGTLVTFLGVTWKVSLVRKRHYCRRCDGVILAGVHAYRPLREDDQVMRYRRLCTGCAEAPMPVRR